MLTGNASLLMAHLVRCPMTISVASGLLQPQELAEHTGDGLLGRMWEASRDYFTKYNTPIPLSFMTDAVRTYIQESTPDQAPTDEIANFLAWIYDSADSDFNHAEIVCHLEAVLRDVKVIRPMEDGLSSGEDLNSLFDRFQRGLSASYAGTTDVIDPMTYIPNDPNSCTKLVLGTSATKYFNLAVNGGLKAGELVVLMGPTGGFKTSMMVDLAASMAEMGQHSLFLAHEQSADSGDLVVRFKARGSRISRELLESPLDIQNLPPELREKFNKAIGLGKYMKILDRTQHSDPIAAVARLVEERINIGCKPEVVFIDQLITWIKKWNGIDDRPDSLRKAVSTCTLALKHNVAEKFGTRIILAHQIASAQIGRSGGKSYHHTDSSEAKDVANWVDFALTIGSVDPISGIFKLCSPKARRGSAATELLIKPLPLTCEFILVNDDYEECKYQRGAFVKKGDAGKIPDKSVPTGVRPAI